MTHPTESSLTVLLNRWQLGDEDAFARVLETAMRDLEHMAEARMRGEDRPTIQPNDLLNEALIRLMESTTARVAKGDRTNADEATLEATGAETHAPQGFASRTHFFATMSLHMRSILVDRARARKADKRGGGAVHVTLSNALDAEESMIADLIALDEVLNSLELQDPRGAQILHLTYFAGLTRDEIAEVMQISVPTVDRELRFARAWLTTQLGHDLA